MHSQLEYLNCAHSLIKCMRAYLVINSSVENVRNVNCCEMAIVPVLVYYQLCVVNSSVSNVRIVHSSVCGHIQLECLKCTQSVLS